MRATKKRGDENAAKVYEQIVNLAMYFYEWRHKLLRALFTVATASIAATVIWAERQPGRLNGLALAAAALFGLVAIGLDIRTQRILNGLYKRGEEYAGRMGMRDGGALAGIPCEGLDRLLTFHVLIRVLAGALALVFMTVAVWIFVTAPFGTR